MSVSAIGSNALYNQMQSVNKLQQSLSTNTLKSAMNSPQQYLDLLQQSISVKSSVDLANGLGINVDTTA
jgi:hypothetical protein